MGFPLQIIPILCVTHIIWKKNPENFKMAYGNYLDFGGEIKPMTW